MQTDVNTLEHQPYNLPIKTPTPYPQPHHPFTLVSGKSRKEIAGTAPRVKGTNYRKVDQTHPTKFNFPTIFLIQNTINRATANPLITPPLPHL